VLCPTRELAQQIQDSFRTYGQHARLRSAVVFGGVGQNPQAAALRAGVDILVATPGRLIDLMGQRLADVGGVEILVLDEADRMLDMGFLPDLRRILRHVPAQRQTLLFSATLPDPIRQLAHDFLRKPVPVQVARVSSAAPSVAHWVHFVEKADKPALLTGVLTHTGYTRALVFTRTKHGADKVARQLTRDGVRAAALHGNKTQGARTRVLGEFRAGDTPVLVATDIAARGLDVDDISHVINYDLTHEPEVYVHRIGRTGRMGAVGTAVSFCTGEQHDELRAIEKLICGKLQPAPAVPGIALRTGTPRPSSPRQPAPHTTQQSGSSRARPARHGGKPSRAPQSARSAQPARPAAQTARPRPSPAPAAQPPGIRHAGRAPSGLRRSGRLRRAARVGR
jgi:ATP-dependent RNA helicase RhlE